MNKNSQEIIVLVSICAKSLGTDDTSQKLFNTRNNTSIKIAKSKNMAQSNYSKASLSKASKALNLHYSNAGKINYILTNYSSKNNCHKKDTVNKYIQKFKYVYNQHFYHQRSIKSNNTETCFNKIQKIGIIALYTGYKLLTSNSKLYICAKIIGEADHPLF